MIKNDSLLNEREQDQIDVVYTWVDDSDPIWQENRQMRSLQLPSQTLSKDTHAKNRYRNRDELRYSLRSVHEFAKFINHIYIITSGQRPPWLKDHPKITVISHEEIFPNKEHLPTFNSQAIEAHLHRIPNLAEKFLYFNDDFFLGTEVQPTDFFTNDGKICVYLTVYTVATGPHAPNDISFHSAWKNTDALLSLRYKNEIRYEIAHIPYALTKSLLKETESLFPEIFELVSSNPFRMQSDYTLTNGLVQYHALYTDKGLPTKARFFFFVIISDLEHILTKLEMIRTGNYKFFCIQDVTSEDTHVIIDPIIRNSLENYFPEPAPWEY